MNKKQTKKRSKKFLVPNKQIIDSNFSKEDSKQIRIYLNKKERKDIMSIINFLKKVSQLEKENKLLSTHEIKTINNVKRKFFYEPRPSFFRYELNLFIEVIKKLSVLLDRSVVVNEKLETFYKSYYKNNILSRTKYDDLIKNDNELRDELTYRKFEEKIFKSFVTLKNTFLFLFYSVKPSILYILKLFVEDEVIISKKIKETILLFENFL